MAKLDVLTALWAAWCAQQGIECRDAAEMSQDFALPRDVRAMAAAFGDLWDFVADA